MSEPHDRISDELISAYLDGELDSQQRAEVERLLDSEPRYEQLLEELRTLRETLQSLPRRRLGESFQQRVLRLAEQRSAAATLVKPERKPVAGDGRKPTSGGFTRGLYWAAAAVAAAILLTVFGPQEADRHNIGPVALNTPAPEAPDAAPVPVDSQRDAMLRGQTPGQEERRLSDGFGRAGTAGEAPDLPADAATDFSVRARRSKGGPETPEMEAAPIVPADPFATPPMDALKPADPQPESGVQAEADAAPSSHFERVAGTTLGEIAPVDAAPVAGAGIDTSSADLLADAVIHISLGRAEKSPEVRLTENLARNQIAVVRQEPTVDRQRRPSVVPEGIQEVAEAEDKMDEELRTRKERAVYFTNQAAVDLALVPSDVKAEWVKLYLVQAPATQMATAVNQLQQEGGTVLAAFPGPRPEAASMPEGDVAGVSAAGRSALSFGMTAAKGAPHEGRRYVERQRYDRAVDSEAWNDMLGKQAKAFDVNRTTTYSDAPNRGARTRGVIGATNGQPGALETTTPNPEIPKTPSAGAVGQSIRPMSLEDTAELATSDRSRALQEEQPSDGAVPALRRGEQTRETRPDGRDGVSNQLGSFQTGRFVSPPDSPSSHAQQRHWYRTLSRNPQELQKQFTDLRAGRSEVRPLQFLIVLHGQEDLAADVAEAAEAAPAVAEPPAESAPSDPP